jgi:hypothetical protein
MAADLILAVGALQVILTLRQLPPVKMETETPEVVETLEVLAVLAARVTQGTLPQD